MESVAEINMIQREADALFEMEKHRVSDDVYDLPSAGQKEVIKLQSVDGREEFLLDLWRGRIDLHRVMMQNRARQVVRLARLDIGGAPHRNPDDEEIPAPHLHLYREGYGDSWAIPIPLEYFTATEDPYRTLEEFMSYCNITEPPKIQRGMFR